MQNTKKTAAVIIALAVVLAVGVTLLIFGLKNNSGNKIPFKLILSPVDTVCEKGFAAVFSVKAEGTDLSYKWECFTQKGSWSELNINESEIKLVAKSDMNGNIFRCTVTDKYGESAVSNEAKLTVTNDHTYGEKVILKAPTCLLGGECYYVCTSCGKKKTETLPENGHSFTESVSYTGKRQYKCSVCSYTFSTDLTNKTDLEAALKKIPPHVDDYYLGSTASTLAKAERELTGTVFGVKNSDRLSQSEADDYTSKINSALDGLTFISGENRRIYVSTLEDGEITLSGTVAFISSLNGSTVEAENKKSSILYYTDYASEQSYKIAFDGIADLAGLKAQSLKLISGGCDRSLMRTAAGVHLLSVLGDKSAEYSVLELWINGKYMGVYTAVPDDITQSADSEALQTAFFNPVSYETLSSLVDTNSFARLLIAASAFEISPADIGYLQLCSKNGKICAVLPENLCLTCGNNQSEQNKEDEYFLPMQNDFFKVLWGFNEFRQQVSDILTQNEQDLDSFANETLKNIADSNLNMFRRNFTDTNKSLIDDTLGGYIAGETVESNAAYFISCFSANLKALKQKYILP